MWGETDWWKGIQSKNGANALIGLGTGLLQGNTFAKGLAAGGQGFMQGSQLDEQYAAEAERKAKEEQGLNSTIEYMRSKGYTDLLAGVESGGMDMGAAWTEALRRGQPQAPKPPIEVGGVLVDPVTFQPVFDSRQPEKPPAPPSGYRWNPDGTQSYVPGGPADPAFATPKAPTEAERKAGALTTVTQQDAALLFGDGTNPGIFDALGGTVDQSLQAGAFGLNPLAGLASSDYKVAKDAISNITQSYLYAMSGATAPPEEVKKISEQVTPQPFDSPEQKKAKRDRLLAMYQAIEGAQGNAAPGDGGWEVIGVQ